MRKTLTITTLLLCLSAVHAQQGYRSFFGQESTEWYIEDRFEFGNHSSKYFFLGDTLYDGKHYKLAYRISYGLEYTPDEELEPRLTAAIREDTATGRMWINHLFPSLEETLLVDMTLEVGDVFQIWQTVVETTIDTAGRKVIVFDDGSLFVEGIGATAPSPSLTGVRASNLLCAYHDGVRVYQASFLNPAEYDLEHCTSKYVSVPSVAAQSISVSPNPAGDHARILSGFGLNAVEVHDISGRHVMTLRASGHSARLDTRALAPGTYTLRIHTAAGTATKRLVVQ